MKNLSHLVGANYYTVSEQMAFALQALTTIDTKAEEDIAVMLVVRDADGKLVTFEESQRQWSTMAQSGDL